MRERVEDLSPEELAECEAFIPGNQPKAPSIKTTFEEIQSWFNRDNDVPGVETTDGDTL